MHWPVDQSVQHVVWCGNARQYLHDSDVSTLASDAPSWYGARARVESDVLAVTPSGAARPVEDLCEANTLVRIEATAGTSTLSERGGGTSTLSERGGRIRGGWCAE
jgi:hypothetical protein